MSKVFLRSIKSIGNEILKGKKFLDYLKKNPVEKKFLGRWNIDHNSNVFRKVDLTNEDHCGTCNEIRLSYVDENITKSNQIKKSKIKKSYRRMKISTKNNQLFDYQQPFTI